MAMKTAAYEHDGGDAGQQGWIRRWRICWTATDEMWDDGDGEIGCKDGDGLGKYRQGKTANLRAYRRSRIMWMAEKISSEDSVGRAWWSIYGTARMDTAVEEMRDGNRMAKWVRITETDWANINR